MGGVGAGDFASGDWGLPGRQLGRCLAVPSAWTVAQGAAPRLVGVCLGTPTRLCPLTRLPARSGRDGGPFFTVLWSSREAIEEAEGSEVL